MSTFQCAIETVEEVTPHPNADRLDLVRIRGYRAVTQRGLHQVGDAVLYIPTDAVLPEDVLEAFGFAGKLAGKAKNRVKPVRLRGELSEGLVIPVRVVSDFLERTTATGFLALGADVAERLGITKWEPEIPVHMAGEVIAAPEWFRLFYDVENIKAFPDVLQTGELLLVTEKLHGTNAKFGWHRNEGFFVASRRRDTALVESVSNLYWRVAREYDIEDSMRRMADYAGVDALVLCGEIFGKGVQDLHYGNERPAFRVFDVRQPLEGRWMDLIDVRTLMEGAGVGLSIVPVVGAGQFTLEQLHGLASGESTLADHVQEGVVVRSLRERHHPSLGRVMLKVINPDYLTRSGGSEYH